MVFTEQKNFKKNKANDEIRVGMVVEGPILEKTSRYVLIDLSRFGVGMVRGFYLKEAKTILKDLKEGDKVVGRVIDVDNEEGYIELSLQGQNFDESWEKISQLKEENKAFPILILEANAGGLIAKLENITGFLPVSQLATEHYPQVEGGSKEKILEKLKNFVGQNLTVKILDFDPQVSKLIFSEKLVEKDKISEAINQFKVGDLVKVKITKIVDYGAFCRIQDVPQLVDGLIHVTEIPLESPIDKSQSGKMAAEIKTVLTEGDVKEAKVVSVDNGRICLSLKNISPSNTPSKINS